MYFGKALGYRLGALFAGIYVICGIIVYTAPDLAHKILELLTHSIWQFTIQPFNIVNFLIGIILWAVIGILVGFALSGLCECIKDNDKTKKEIKNR